MATVKLTLDIDPALTLTGEGRASLNTVFSKMLDRIADKYIEETTTVYFGEEPIKL